MDSRKARFWVYIGGVIAAVVVVAAIAGIASKGQDAPSTFTLADQADTTIPVTTTATATVTEQADPATTTVRVTKTRTVTEKPDPSTPASCMAALTDADQLLSLMAQALQAAKEGSLAIQAYDTAGIDAATATLTEINSQVNTVGPQYQQDKYACQSLG